MWWGDNNKLNVSLPLDGIKQDSALAELTAVIKALEQARGHFGEKYSKLEVKTDCEYVRRCVRDIPIWRKNGWRTLQGLDVKNKKEIKKLSHHLRKFQQLGKELKCTHVNSHTGVYGNEEADRLAKLGAK